jgi:predicted metalloprotease
VSCRVGFYTLSSQMGFSGFETFVVFVILYFVVVVVIVVVVVVVDTSSVLTTTTTTTTNNYHSITIKFILYLKQVNPRENPKEPLHESCWLLVVVVISSCSY